jgi:hypothetical protein
MRVLLALLLVGCGYPSEVPIAAEPAATVVTPKATPPAPPEVTFASAVSVEGVTRIALVDAAGHKKFVTEGPRDAEGVLSPDRRSLAFVRQYASGTPADLFVLSASGKLERVVEGASGFEGIASPLYSPDSSTIYFMADKWATSPAAYALNVATGKATLLFDGVVTEVRPNGNLVAQHFRIVWNKGMSEGRQEMWTLNDKNGKELRKLPTDPSLREKAL